MSSCEGSFMHVWKSKFFVLRGEDVQGVSCGFVYKQELLPINKRTMENFENVFCTADLQPIVEFQVKKGFSLS